MAEINHVVDLRDQSDGPKKNKTGGGLSKKKPKLTKKRKIILIVAACVVAAAIIGGICYFLFYSPLEPEMTQGEDIAVQEPESAMVRSPINGVMISREEADKNPTAIMIENSTPARPQSALVSADVVYEALAEGGITRFLCVFQSEIPNEVGPVRSMRPYYLQMALGYSTNTVAMYSGAAQFVLDLVRESGIRDMSATYGGSVLYWRDGERAAPHNLYTSGEKIAYMKEDNDWNDSVRGKIDEWIYEERKAQADSEKITINYSSESYRVDWTFDKDNNVYKRENGGMSHVDRRTGEQIVASTVILLRTDTWARANDDHGRREMTIVGSGEGMVYKNGEAIEMSWEKESETNRFQFYERGTQTKIPLEPGKIWIEVVPTETEVTVE